MAKRTRTRTSPRPRRSTKLGRNPERSGSERYALADEAAVRSNLPDEETAMTFNEWRHRHTNYDNRMRGAIALGAQREIQEQIALEAMQLAYVRGDKAFAAQVMEWAKSKRLLEA